MQRSSLGKSFAIGVFGIVALASHGRAAEITSSRNLVKPIIDGESAHAWSPDGSRVMLAESRKDNQRTYLCIYSLATSKKEKCIYTRKAQAHIFVQGIDWTDAYIHVAVGFHDSPTIFRLPVPNWRMPEFKEIDMDAFDSLPGTYGDPAWDRWEEALFFSGEDERYGIQYLKEGKPAIKYASGVDPSVTRHYLWYSAFIESDLFVNGISRIEKASRRQTNLTTKHHDVSVSPRQDEKAALFIRKDLNTTKTSLHAYVEGQGVTGPLLSSNERIGEELRSVKLSPDGKHALLSSSHVLQPEKLRAVVTIKLLSVRW